MLEASFSPLIPTEKSEDFYRQFYNQYCLIETNDALVATLSDRLTEEEIASFIEKLNGFNFDNEYIAVMRLGANLMDEAAMRRRKESRGISTDTVKTLLKEDINPLQWYNTNTEFLMIYAITEQAVKDYIHSVNPNDDRNIKEDNLINLLCDTIKATSEKSREAYLCELADSIDQIIDTQNKLHAAWRYFTAVRHCLVHSGGQKTDKIYKNFMDFISKNEKELTDINQSMFIELDDSENFFGIPFNNGLVSIDDKHMNFFRNLCLRMIESLEKVLHPDEFEIKDFDPYKL